ncbi:MAG: hypothetical protein HS113_21130 [Verrucomicrobiales bacterium]|nr:hypothetical protein [Verrucomicrobiales bacterium]
MPTSIEHLWVPDVWLAAMREKLATRPSLFNSPVVSANPKAAELANGPGETAVIPFWKDITDQDDEVQKEDTAPAVDNVITAGVMKAVACNRVTKNSSTALAAAVSGGEPVGEMIAQMATRRLKQRQKTLLAMLRGAFGSGAGAPNNTDGCLNALKVDKFSEAGATPAPDQLMSVDLFITSKALMGELMDDLFPGALLIHPNVVAGLEKADVIAFKEASLGPFTIRTYRGIPFFVSESLVRAGGTSGYVYDTYLLGPGILAYGEKPQIAGNVVNVAALQFEQDKAKNNEVIYDRTRFVLHLNGLRWKGTIQEESPENSDLQTAGNWELVYQTPNRVGGICIRTNG